MSLIPEPWNIIPFVLGALMLLNTLGGWIDAAKRANNEYRHLSLAGGVLFSVWIFSWGVCMSHQATYAFIAFGVLGFCFEIAASSYQRRFRQM